MPKAETPATITPRALRALCVIAEYQRGNYRLGDRLIVSPRMWNVLLAAGLVEPTRRERAYSGDGRVHWLTEAGWEIADHTPMVGVRQS